MSTASHGAAFAPPDLVAADGRLRLTGLPVEALQSLFAEYGLEKFRARQIFAWIYGKGVRDFDAMTDLSKKARAILQERFTLERPGVARAQISQDGTRKWLLRMSDHKTVESVFIPEESRGTICVSSQIGCTLTCRFCHTGTMPLVRNLGPGEILDQILVARDDLADWPSHREDRHLTNIVLMGMGEPLYNFDNVATAMRIAMAGDGLALSRRRITLSTSGVVPMIERCGRELGVKLAISLHAAQDSIRSQIMPINRAYPLADLIAACRAYPGLSNAMRITFEYVMLDQINDSPADARALVRLIEGIPAKINLIPFNPWPNSPFERSKPEAIERFARIILSAGYPAPIRTPRGEDILAACGQLKSAAERSRPGA